MHKYKITIADLTFDAIVGILDKERKEAQKVVADIEIEYEKRGEAFINYAEVAFLVEERMQKEKFLLLEEALEAIMIAIKSKFPAVLKINLKLSKPNILDNCVVSVEIFRQY